jgi:outer membrane murein-binding lipoprotein Lpp
VPTEVETLRAQVRTMRLQIIDLERKNDIQRRQIENAKMYASKVKRELSEWLDKTVW